MLEGERWGEMLQPKTSSSAQKSTTSSAALMQSVPLHGNFVPSASYQHLLTSQHVVTVPQVSPVSADTHCVEG